MKKIKYLLVLSLLMTTFLSFAQEKNPAKNEAYLSVGEEVEVNDLLSAYQMQERYDSLKPGDTLNVTFKGDVASVCKKKGCWMNVSLENGKEVMVKFKDYAFFVPKDIGVKR